MELLRHVDKGRGNNSGGACACRLSSRIAGLCDLYHSFFSCVLIDHYETPQHSLEIDNRLVFAMLQSV